MLDYLQQRDKEQLSAMGYEIVRKLAEGSFSKVYLTHYINPKARERKEFPKDMHTPLAVKFIDGAELPANAVRFVEREINFLTHVSHPHIIHVHSIMRRANVFMVFMRLAEYGNLCTFIQNYGSVKEKFARIWMRQLALALDYLHTLGIAHRAVKCENVLVTCNNNIKLSDFGFATFTEDLNGSPIECQTFCGSMHYAAPEIIKGGNPYQGKLADLWSLGVVMYVMLNKQFPFKYEKIGELWENQMKQNYQYLPEVKASVSPECVTVNELLLRPNPPDRLPLQYLLRCKWMSLQPNLLKMTPQEKLALTEIERTKNFLRPRMVKPEDTDDQMFAVQDAVYRAIVEKDPCDQRKIEKFNRGTFTYGLFPQFENNN